MTFEQRPEEVKLAAGHSRAKGTAGARAVRWERAWRVWGSAVGPAAAWWEGVKGCTNSESWPLGQAHTLRGMT